MNRTAVASDGGFSLERGYGMDWGNLIYEMSGRKPVVGLLILYFTALAALCSKRAGYLRAFRYKAALLLAVAGHLVLIAALCCRSLFLHRYVWLIATGNIILGMVIFLLLKSIPSAAQKQMDLLQKQYGTDLLGCYRNLLKIDTKHLTPGELLRWKRFQYQTLYLMGSMNKAIEIMKSVDSKEPVRSRILYSLKEETLGNTDKARELMLKACDALKAGEEDWLKVQVYNNLGRCYRFCGNNDAALRYYNQAADLVTEKTDREIVHAIYTNLIAESCIMERPVTEIERLLAEYKRYIRPGVLDDNLEYDNAALSVAREKNDTKEIRRIVEESYDGIRALLKEEKDRKRAVHYNISTLKIACNARLNPVKYMDAVSDDFGYIKDMEMPDRYYILKDLSLMTFGPAAFSESFLERYRDVFDYVNQYFPKNARDDLEQYLNEIPSEAVYAYGHTQQELIWIERFSDSYDLKRVYARFRAVIDLYNSQSLRLEAIICAGNLVDELLAPQNLNPDFTLKYPDIMEKELSELAGQMKEVKYHAGCAETYLRIAFCYIYLYRYKECAEYYGEFLKCRIHENHFSVWTKGNLRFIRFVSRLWKIAEGLNALKEGAASDPVLSEEEREWLLHGSDETGEETAVLLGVGLGLEKIYVKAMRWQEKLPTGILVMRYHCWLVYGEEAPLTEQNSLAEVDLRYGQVADEKDSSRMIFFPQTHPLERGRTRWVKSHVLGIPQIQYRVYSADRLSDSRFGSVFKLGTRLRESLLGAFDFTY